MRAVPCRARQNMPCHACRAVPRRAVPLCAALHCAVLHRAVPRRTASCGACMAYVVCVRVCMHACVHVWKRLVGLRERCCLFLQIAELLYKPSCTEQKLEFDECSQGDSGVSAQTSMHMSTHVCTRARAHVDTHTRASCIRVCTHIFAHVCAHISAHRRT